MKVIVFWVGTTSKGVNTIGVKYFKDGFACKSFVEVEDIGQFSIDQELTIPKEALN